MYCINVDENTLDRIAKILELSLQKGLGYITYFGKIYNHQGPNVHAL